MLFDWVIERPKPHPQRHKMCALLHLACEIERPDWGTETPKEISRAIKLCAPLTYAPGGLQKWRCLSARVTP